MKSELSSFKSICYSSHLAKSLFELTLCSPAVLPPLLRPITLRWVRHNRQSRRRPYRGRCFISGSMFSRPRTPHVSRTWTQFGPLANLLQAPSFLWHHTLFDQVDVLYIRGKSGNQFYLSKYWTICWSFMVNIVNFRGCCMLQILATYSYNEDWIDTLAQTEGCRKLHQWLQILSENCRTLIVALIAPFFKPPI